jgi:two-component system chemotaxis sensor kinase CheA
MDAVRRAVEALGGQVELRSVPGAGTTLAIAVPQRAAVTSLLTVRVGDEVLGVPTEAVAEVARLSPERILPLRGGEAFVLRDRTVPLLRLGALLGLPARPRQAGGVPVLVTGAGRGKVGLEIDGIAGQLDVLVRPLGGLLAGLPAVSGTALLGDGRVMVVLDIAELVG